MRTLLLVSALAVSACSTSSLPEADDAADLGIRSVWAAVQDAVRTGDAAELAALQDPDPGAVDPGAAEGAAQAVVDAAAAWPELRDAILATRAFELTRYEDGRYAFLYTPPGGPQPDGFEITFRVAPDGEVYLSTATPIG